MLSDIEFNTLRSCIINNFIANDAALISIIMLFKYDIDMYNKLMDSMVDNQISKFYRSSILRWEKHYNIDILNDLLSRFDSKKLNSYDLDFIINHVFEQTNIELLEQYLDHVIYLDNDYVNRSILYIIINGFKHGYQEISLIDDLHINNLKLIYEKIGFPKLLNELAVKSNIDKYKKLMDYKHKMLFTKSASR